MSADADDQSESDGSSLHLRNTASPMNVIATSAVATDRVGLVSPPITHKGRTLKSTESVRSVPSRILAV